MTAHFNRESNLVEIYHNGKMVDTASGMSDAMMRIGFFEKLMRDLYPTIDQDKGRNHILYIRMLAQEICWWENSKSNSAMSWNDCVKLAFRLHTAKLKK